MRSQISRFFSSNKNLLALAAIIAGAFTLRYWAIHWGLPLRQGHIDESVMIFYSMHLFSGHVFYDYPTAFVYILWGVFAGEYVLAQALGLCGSLEQFMGMYLSGDPSVFYLSARMVSVAAGTASVYILYKIGKEQWGEGLLPALLLAVLPYHVLHSHYATTDVTAVFFLLYAFLYFGRFYSSSATPDLYKGSFILGLATATKYYPAIFALPLCFYLILWFRRDAARMTVYCIGWLAAGFVAGCPYVLLHFSSFKEKFLYQAQLIIGSPSMAGNPFALSRITGLVSDGPSIALLLVWAGVTAGGMAAGVRAQRQRMLFWLSFPATYLVALSGWKSVGERYLLCVYPFLILAGVYALTILGGRFRRPRLVFLAVPAVALVLLAGSIRHDAMLARPDTRNNAHQWITEHIPAGARMIRTINTPEFTRTDPYSVKVDWFGALLDKTYPEALARDFDYVIIGGALLDNAAGLKKKLSSRYRLIKHWPRTPSPAFHNPEIAIYQAKQLPA